ncbi:hypothetical protein [Duganella vulcania]|uniref:Lipoprotein n=1 Tax=Duganella vulcania TaxID=2692166 RepID=A0A845GJZ5_9BURK|nr:hypothetical protein [Duganella vulcania]MYM93715.1 hypothetical protein [Duganella vulcania]
MTKLALACALASTLAACGGGGGGGSTPATDAGSVVVQPAPPSAGPVADTKALFGSLRTNLQAWSDANKDGGGLSNSSHAMKADFDIATSPLDQNLANWISVSFSGIKLYDDFIQKRSTAITIKDGESWAPMGACTLYKDMAAIIPMTSNDVSSVTPRSVSCTLNGMAVEGSERKLASSSLYTHTLIGNSITLTPAASGSFAYTTQTMRFSQTYYRDQYGPYGYQPVSGGTLVGNATQGTIGYRINGDILTTLQIDGTMPAHANAAGTLITDYETWHVKASTTAQASGINSYALSGSISAVKNGAALGTVKLADTSFIRASVNGNRYRAVEAKLDIEVATANNSASGTLTLNNFETDKYGSGYQPSYTQFSGNFTNSRAESFKGVITVEVSNYKNYISWEPQSATNFAPTKTSFKGSLKIVGRPVLDIEFANHDTSYNTAQFNGTYNDGANAITFDGNTAPPGTTHIASATGVTVTLVDGVKLIDVYKNNSKTAQINTGTRVINYIDGTFETLN